MENKRSRQLVLDHVPSQGPPLLDTSTIIATNASDPGRYDPLSHFVLSAPWPAENLDQVKSCWLMQPKLLRQFPLKWIGWSWQHLLLAVKHGALVPPRTGRHVRQPLVGQLVGHLVGHVVSPPLSAQELGEVMGQGISWVVTLGTGWQTELPCKATTMAESKGCWSLAPKAPQICRYPEVRHQSFGTIALRVPLLRCEDEITWVLPSDPMRWEFLDQITNCLNGAHWMKTDVPSIQDISLLGSARFIPPSSYRTDSLRFTDELHSVSCSCSLIIIADKPWVNTVQTRRLEVLHVLQYVLMNASNFQTIATP